MLDLSKVGNTISGCRKDKGYTQDELASRLGVTPQAVSKWERGTSLPDTDMLPEISKMLGISVDELLMGVAPFNETLQVTAETPANPFNVNDLLLPPDISVKISTGLCMDNQAFIDALASGLTSLRRRIAVEYGFPLPTIRLRDDISLPDGEYTIAFRKKNYGSGHIYKDLLFTFTDDTLLKGIPATNFQGSHILWMTESEQSGAGNLTYSSGDKMIITHLYELILQNPDVIITRQMVKVIVENLAEHHPVLVSDTVPARIGYGMLREVLADIIRAKKPISDMVTILEIVDRLICEKVGYKDMVYEIASKL